MKAKLLRFFDKCKVWARRYACLLVVFLIVLVAPLQACAAVQPALPAMQKAAEVSVTMVTPADIQAAASQDGTFVMANGGKYLISWLTESGRVFAFNFDGKWMARGLFCGIERTCGMEVQFIKDNWQLLGAPAAKAVLIRIMSLPMPSIWLLPITPEMNLENWLKGNPIQG